MGVVYNKLKQILWSFRWPFLVVRFPFWPRFRPFSNQRWWQDSELCLQPVDSIDSFSIVVMNWHGRLNTVPPENQNIIVPSKNQNITYLYWTWPHISSKIHIFTEIGLFEKQTSFEIYLWLYHFFVFFS